MSVINRNFNKYDTGMDMSVSMYNKIKYGSEYSYSYINYDCSMPYNTYNTSSYISNNYNSYNHSYSGGCKIAPGPGTLAGRPSVGTYNGSKK